jgi:hypothetical protein
MKKRRFSIFVTRSLWILLMVLSLAWTAGCGSGTGDGTTASSADVQNAATAVALVGLEVSSNPLGSGAAMALDSNSKSAAATLFKSAFTPISTSSCSERSLPSLSSAAGQPWTLYGSQFTCLSNAGSGSCSVTHEETSASTGKAIIDCNNLIFPIERSDGLICDDVILDGKFGIDYMVSSDGANTTYDIDFSSENLREAGLNCDLRLAFSFNQTTDSTGSATESTNGCLAECGDAFTLSGSDTL